MSEQITRSEDDAVITKVLQRSTTDRDFRTRLLAEPDRAIEEVIGVPLSTLPKQYRVRFVEKDPDVDALVVLPDYEDPEGTLSDAQLEAVAGGDWCITSCGWSIDICFISSGNEIGCK